MRKVMNSLKLSIIKVERWQQIQKFRVSNFRIFARGRVGSIRAVGARKDMWREINI